MGNDDASESTVTKVGRLLGKYDLGEDYGVELEAAWTGESGERASLRDLAASFNRDLLAAAMDDAGTSTIDGEIERVYRALDGDGVTAGTTTEVRSRLAREGVDVESLERDFVTYQAIRSYLQRERGADYQGPDAGNRRERTAETIGRLRSRLAAVTENNLAQLREADQLTLGEFRLFTSVDVLCEECGSQYPAVELIERGGCDCRDDGSE